MKLKRASRVLSLALLCALLAQLCVPARAEGESDTVYINDVNALRAFAEQCAYDAWSEGKTVVLRSDLSLGGVDFLPIASFGGTFEGNGHTISGLNVSSSVSPAGLFGTIAPSGIVHDLNVEGSVAPGGSAERAGGIVGLNRGTVAGCSFTGTVNGEKRVGGIAGENAASGTIRRCTVSGGVFGKNMTGGIAGANHGTVSMCVNHAYVNTNTLDPSVSFDKFDLNMANGVKGLASPENFNVTVDSGGVAGFSDGALLGCRNDGSVGYQHIGYNVGGVAGRSGGHIATCTNEGVVCGRREVGGVVGMAEPYVKLNIEKGSLEQVRHELNTLSGIVDRTVRDAESASQTVSARLTEINRGVDEATERAQTLTGHLSNYWDGTVTEINRGSEIADAAIAQMYEISDDLTDASGTLTQALGELKQALGTFNGSGTTGELSAMANDLSVASDIFDTGTKQINTGLGKLNGAVGPKEGVSEEEWRNGVYGDGGALDHIRNGTAQAISGMSKVTSVLSGLTGEISDGNITTPDGVISYLGNNGMDAALEEAAKGFEEADRGVQYINDNTKVDNQAVKDGFDAIHKGVDILANGKDGKNGAFHYISSGLAHLSRAVKDGEVTSRELETSIGTFRDASSEMTSALQKTEKLLDYLRNQEKLSFETLGAETDAQANALYDSMHGISNNLQLLNQETKSASDVVLADVRQINTQFNVLMNTLLDVVDEAENMSVSTIVQDTSDEDVDAAVDGKVLLCGNSGEISGDIDVGGVAGAMMVYNELDPENDDDTVSSTFHRRYELKCILQDCTNSGTVTGKRDNVGSVCGSAALGVISGCEAYGTAKSESGDCVGGIAGYADNIIRKCWSRCSLAGAKYVGGVVGSGRADRSNLRVEDCRAFVEVSDSGQYAGSIMGGDTGTLSGNLFVSDTLAGVNRVSERGKAEPISYEQMLALEGLPKAFRSITLTFVANGETVLSKRLHYGESYDAADFPDIPAVEGNYAYWDRTELKDLRFDTTVTAMYEPCVTAIASGVTRSASRPTFFVQGAFNDAASLSATPAVYDFDDGQDGLWARLRSYKKTLLEQWQLTLPADGAATHTVRYLPPEGVRDHIELYVRGANGWTRLTTGKMGSYLTFETEAQELELTVLSTATPWWVWTLVGVFLAVAAALLVVLLIRKKPKRELTDEEKAKAAVRKKRHKTVRVILIAALLALGAAVGAALVFAPGLTDSMGLYMLLRNYAERTELDMKVSVSTRVDGRSFEADADLYLLPCEGKRVSCVCWKDVPLYYCDGVMLLENGKAYRAEGVLPDYSKLLTHAALLYRTMDVNVSEENSVKTYCAEARGEAARQILATLLPDAAATLPETEAVRLELVLSDGEPQSLNIRWNGEAGEAEATLRLAGETREHALPQAVRTAIASGEYAKAENIAPELKRLLLTWTELAARDPLSADVTLGVNCGPLLLDEKLLWQRTNWNGKELSCVSGRGTRLYYTDEAACTGSGVLSTSRGGSFTGAEQLLHLAYEAFLLGDVDFTETTGGYRCTVTLDAAQMTEIAGTIAPDTRALGISFEEGTLRLDIADGSATSLSVQCRGKVRVVRAEVPASVGAKLDFVEGRDFYNPPLSVRSALGLDES